MNVCDFTCGTGFHRCADHCATDSSAMECGPGCVICPTHANATSTCTSGTCGFVCNTGFVLSGSMCVPITCGNRTLDAGETCDDGNMTSGDGCSAACQMEASTVVDSCTSTPAAALVISDTAGAHQYTGTTSGATDDGAGTCSANGPDVVIRLQFNFTTSYMYTVTVTPSGWTTNVRHGSPCPGTACDTGAASSAAVTYTASATGPTIDYLVVDSPDTTNAGPFTVSVSVM
jgi:cysteine-rich repeat protein